MPTPYIKKLSKQGKGSVDELETKWEQAKKQAEKQDQGDNYAYITKIFQKMAHASTTACSIEINAFARLKSVNNMFS